MSKIISIFVLEIFFCDRDYGFEKEKKEFFENDNNLREINQ